MIDNMEHDQRLPPRLISRKCRRVCSCTCSDGVSRVSAMAWTSKHSFVFRRHAGAVPRLCVGAPHQVHSALIDLAHPTTSTRTTRDPLLPPCVNSCAKGILPNNPIVLSPKEMTVNDDVPTPTNHTSIHPPHPHSFQSN